MIGTATAIVLFWDVSLLMESALNVFYLAMAFYGLWAWQRGGKDHTELRISSWSFNSHLIASVFIVSLTAASGYLLSGNTNASYPFVDSFTTWAAVVTTWMVTRKILENWAYWCVINSVSVWLFLQKELYLYALLFVFYVAISVYGYTNWRRLLRQQRHAT
jgi:nicotinamide mononucleotide transporter